MVWSNHVAYTAAINPASATPKLTTAQIWTGLQLKTRAGQDFVGGAILSTDVISTSTNEQGFPVVVREVVFRDGNKRVRETCVEYEPTKVEFWQEDGSKVQNVISRGSEGELYMTYVFDWLHPECEGDAKALQEKEKGEWDIGKMAVESTIKIMREMVKDGRIK